MAKISINSKILKLINDKNETYKNKYIFWMNGICDMPINRHFFMT
jgi:hypothetical protein